MHTKRLVAFIALAGIAVAAPAQQSIQMPDIALTMNGHKLTAEVAYTDPARMQGLMYRRILPEDRGMLFVFAETARHAMWMKNTYIPLSVAFIDEQGVIINIENMKPQTEDTHPAAKPAKYALEVNLGWFGRHGVRPGAKIDGIDRAPPAR
jgi:uncharacterized membrane protein (UPF0127 family)